MFMKEYRKMTITNIPLEDSVTGVPKNTESAY